ncbi:sigma-54-dependent Fis family transcriptional regulator [Maridesulfovibrio bastinii]|uniref:sigma-54-dependent Fis family transcriptional regulator n=1 Tax=Maridesulfovibrio bastinii TaxID=47157 RepID=UPI000428B853|nr:sigma-54-dependent Fis family transcriptional regulator [Maridesulfovibrio bastinii]
MYPSREFEPLSTSLEETWENFVHTGSHEPGKVRPEISQSWVRCYKARVDPFGNCGVSVLHRHTVDELRNSHAELLEIARPFMNRLYEIIAGSKLVVFLSDENGVILESIGDHEVKYSASKVNLVTGTNWNEEKVGTNGIGTALKLKVPIQISGKEHYCAKLHRWTCSAAPIINDQSEIIGVLQVSGPSREVHLHTLGMVVASVEAICGQIRIKKKNNELKKINHSLNQIFHTMSDGAMITDKDGVISQINKAGKQIFGEDTEGQSIKEILSNRPELWNNLYNGISYSDVELMLTSPKGSFHCLITGTPFKGDNGKTDGAVVFLNQIKNVKKLVNHFSGAQASFNFSDIIGSSEELMQAVNTAKGAAQCTSNVLIYGESGTGKELFAQSIHNDSPRSAGPFIAMNCAAFPRELIASELFGYTDGAFTGARRGGRPGKFEMADGGTLFLDEIGDMPIDQQAMLLRVLQEKKITRIGGDHLIPINVRFVCATNKNLLEEISKGNFRTDLYYRLNVIRVKIPPLKDRMKDLRDLFSHLLAKICQRQGRCIHSVSEKLMQHLQRYDWPGNVRELENVIEKMLSIDLGATELGIEHLPTRIVEMQKAPAVCSSPFYPNPNHDHEHKKKEMSDFILEKELLIKLLTTHKGNISRVAKEMSLSRNTVYRKMNFYKISKEQLFR